MTRFMIGVIVGIFLATVGVSGVLKALDHGVNAVKQQSQTLSN